jgi:hypothetical protein
MTRQTDSSALKVSSIRGAQSHDQSSGAGLGREAANVLLIDESHTVISASRAWSVDADYVAVAAPRRAVESAAAWFHAA